MLSARSSASSQKPRLTRFTILVAAGATALFIGACSSSNKSNPTTSSSSATSSSAPAQGEARVSGLVASVAGNSAQVTQNNGNATVDFTDSTKIIEVTEAALTDVATGSCVTILPTREEPAGGQPISAAAVRVSSPVDGKCPQGKESAAPPPATAPPSGSATAAPARRGPVQGAVASVAGNTINVTSTDASGNSTESAITVTEQTKYTKQATANTQAITAGKCMMARGTRDSSGALQATTISLRPANNGKCAGPGNHGGGRHG